MSVGEGTIYALQETTPPNTDPVSTSVLKSFLRLNTTSEDSLLAGFISSAVDLFQKTTDRQLMLSTYTLYLDAFPRVIRFPRAPLVSVSSIKYYDSSDTLVTYDPDKYVVDIKREPGRVVPKVWFPDWKLFPVWPALSFRVSPKIEIEFVAGYPSANAVPALIKQAIMLLCGHWFDQRSSSTDKSLSDLPMGWRSVVDMYRLNWIANMNLPMYGTEGTE